MRPNAYTHSHATAGTLFRTHVILAVLILIGIIIYTLGIREHHSFGTDEAYSIWAASKPGPAVIIAIPILADPGKQVFYYIVLHYYMRIWGDSELAVRSLSLIFALGAVWLVYSLASDLLGAEAGVAATALWIFNPLAVFFAWQARGYAMFLFVALAQMIALWRLRAAPGIARTIGCGVLTAALLYTHMGGLLLLAAEAAMLLRDFVRGRRNPWAWAAMGIAALLFVPFIPIALAQSRELVSGHWLDWAGTYRYPVAIRIASALTALAVALLMILGPVAERRGDEPLRWLAAWSLLPIIGLGAGSVALRPMFNLRYVVPSLAVLAILAADGLSTLSIKLRNLTVAGFALACLMLFPFDYPHAEPWPEVAKMIAADGGSAKPIFFEAGFTFHGAKGSANGGFPFGYFAIPFDYYFHGENPHVIIPGYDPGAARERIAGEVRAHGGGWLVSWKDRSAGAELPDPHEFQENLAVSQPPLAVYRIIPIPPPDKRASRGSAMHSAIP